ncbi:MAG: hypothetical protein U0R19_06855 [Bryobacteraceae bacterium]
MRRTVGFIPPAARGTRARTIELSDFAPHSALKAIACPSASCPKTIGIPITSP